jgi:hypothetical protein
VKRGDLGLREKPALDDDVVEPAERCDGLVEQPAVTDDPELQIGEERLA